MHNQSFFTTNEFFAYELQDKVKIYIKSPLIYINKYQTLVWFFTIHLVYQNGTDVLQEIKLTL